MVNLGSGIAGAELSMEALVTGMPADRCHYTVALHGPGPMVDRLQSKGVAVLIVPSESWRWWVRRPTDALRFAMSTPLQALGLLRWIRLFRHLRPDIIHFGINRLVEPVVAGRLLGIPSVMHFRDIPSRTDHRFTLGQRGFYTIMNLADRWIANSQATAEDISHHARCQISVIPNALRLEEFDASASDGAKSARHLLATNGHHIAMIGNLNPWKNQRDFVRLAIRVSGLRRDVTFYLVGADTIGHGTELTSMVTEAGAHDRVKFLGHVDEVPALMSELDLLAHTMPYESFGRVLIEAMAARKPVVAFNSGGAAEIVEHGKTGFLVPPGDLEAMSTAVSRLLDDPGLRQRMGEAGRRRVEQHYTLSKHCQAVADLYDELLQDRAG